MPSVMQVSQQLHGWGRFPVVDATVLTPATRAEALAALHAAGPPGIGSQTPSGQLIARGLGRSYGDSSLAERVISTARLDCLLEFDADNGRMRCEAGVTLAELLRQFVPRGWFLPVTPGTRYVTVGGAIASDVHGKNHHLHGCFSEFVDHFHLALPDGRVLSCSRNENAELFHATCGGMGLTGLILEATIRLRRIESAFIDQVTLKAANLEEALELFETTQASTYSVAWIDCLASGRHLGRSLVMTGEHSADGGLSLMPDSSLNVPVDMPDWLLNPWSIRAFNGLYYGRVLSRRAQSRQRLETYFYPLDGIRNWNRLYGRGGFTQYQFVIPKAAGLRSLGAIIQRIAASGRGSFLAVLKVFGPQNDNYCSFPLEGYTLALDFRMEPGLLAFLDELDAMVLAEGGRIYLAKDARMSAATFRQSYVGWEKLQAARAQYGTLGVLSSMQSRRIGLD